jgi:hypothetical protein
VVGGCLRLSGSTWCRRQKGCFYFWAYCFIANCTEQSPSWEANSSSASQETLHFLWNPKVRYRFHNSPSLVPIPSQINPQSSPRPLSYFLKINIDIIRPSKSSSTKWPLYLTPPNKTLHPSLLHTSHLPPLSHFCRLDHPSGNWWGVHTKIYCTYIDCHDTLVSSVVSYREVLCSDLDAGLGYRDLSSAWFTSAPPYKFRDFTSN